MPTSGSKLNSVVEVDESQVGMVMIGVGDGFEVPDTHARIEVWLAMARRGRLENAFFRPFGAGQEGPRLTIAQKLVFILFYPKPTRFLRPFFTGGGEPEAPPASPNVTSKNEVNHSVHHRDDVVCMRFMQLAHLP